MKESLIKTKNKLKKLFSFKRMNPHVYWKNLLYVFFVIITILILLSFYILSQIRNQQIFQIAPKSGEQPSLMDEKLFNKVTESFNNKLVKEKEVEDSPTEYKDPSLK